MIAPRSKKPSSPPASFPMMNVQRLDIFRADPRSVPLVDERPRWSYRGVGPTPRDELDIRYNRLHHVPGPKCASFAPPRVPMAPLSPGMPRPLPLSPHPEFSGSRNSSGIQSDAPVIDRSLSSSHRPHPESPPRPSRAFFDVVLSAPATALAHAPAADTTPPDTHPPSKPPTLSTASRTIMKRKSRKPRQPTPDESSSEDESTYEPSDESSDEDEPAPARGLVQISAQGCSEPAIRISDVRGTTPDTSCEETRRLFDIEYSTHKKPQRRSSRRSSPRPKPQVEPVRKSSRLATRPATPVEIDSATDVSVIGSSRSVSVVSVRPTRKPKAKAKSKAAPRTSTSSNSSRDQSTPQPTSMAYPPDDPPPPAPTHVVSLRPGYNAYTSQDKQWFLDFVAWVFRQNVHAGKAEICQDIFQQAPHHRLESWKSYWRDHISQVEMLRNQARDRLEKQTPPLGKGSANRSRDKQSYARPSPSSVTSTESTEPKVAIQRSMSKPIEEANKPSGGLWELAELAELQRPSAPSKLSPVSTGSLKRRAQETSSDVARTKRPKC